MKITKEILEKIIFVNDYSDRYFLSSSYEIVIEKDSWKVEYSINAGVTRKIGVPAVDFVELPVCDIIRDIIHTIELIEEFC